MFSEKIMDFNHLVGHTLNDVQIKDNEELKFFSTTGEVFKLYHIQDCCEDVKIEDITGDLEDLLNSPILQADEETNESHADSVESYTWTFYKIATNKGSVTIRWLGQSNGFYSESVDFVKEY